MNPFKALRSQSVQLTEDQAHRLSEPQSGWNTVEVRPPLNNDHSATLPRFVNTIKELQTSWFGLRNTSPTTAFEIRRYPADTLRLQYSTPTEQLERKIRTHLSNELPEIGLKAGRDGLPVLPGDTVGGALLTTGRRDWYPLQTQHEDPPTNSIISALHRHAMQNTGFVIQLLFKPVFSDPVTRWWRNKLTNKQISYLRNEKEELLNSRSPTPHEKKQANLIKTKSESPRFRTSIRVLVINGREYTFSRVKELAGAFNVFQHPHTGQYLTTRFVRPFQGKRILDYASAVAERKFGGWSHGFQTSAEELGGLVSIPDCQQKNIQYSLP